MIRPQGPPAIGASCKFLAQLKDAADEQLVVTFLLGQRIVGMGTYRKVSRHSPVPHAPNPCQNRNLQNAR